MNWGKGVAIVLGLFIIFIGVLAFTLIRQKVDLVTEDYYKEDMAYQQEIEAFDAGKNLQKLEISQRNDQLILQLDTNIAWDSVTVHLWRPNDKNLDQSFTVSGTNIFMIPLNTLKHGNYDVSCQYWKNGKRSTQKSKVWIDENNKNG